MRNTLISILLFATSVAHAADISGKADIVDGGAIVIAGQQIRLFGIDAPDPAQMCEAGGKPWHCGQEAAFALADAVGRTWVECDIRDGGTLQQVAAICRVGGPKGRDLGAWMVAEGWARADRKAAPGYGTLEDTAKAGGMGLWRR